MLLTQRLKTTQRKQSRDSTSTLMNEHPNDTPNLGRLIHFVDLMSDICHSQVIYYKGDDVVVTEF